MRAPSDHFDGRRFVSPLPPSRRGPLAVARFVAGQVRRRWQWEPSPDAPRFDRPPARVGGLRVSPIGHSSLLVQVAGANLLIDPVFADWLGPWPRSGPRRAHPPGIAWGDLPAVDAVLLTHDHWDHLDAPGLGRLHARFGCRILAPLGCDRHLGGLPVETFDWGEGAALSLRVSARLVPSYHWSGRGLLDRGRSLWGSWLLAAEGGGLLLHVGDTAYGEGAIFRELRATFGPPDVALIPIGAYAPRWAVKGEHVDPDEAVRILLDCGAALGLGHHWGTFRLTWEEREEPLRDLDAALARHGLDPSRFRPLHPGEAVAPPWPGAPESESDSAPRSTPTPPG